VIAQPQSGFFLVRQPGAEIRPGDTIVAMLDAEKVSSLKIWRDVVGNLAGIGSLMSGTAAIYTAIHGQKTKIESNAATTIIAP
jgi:hypothetical protein